MMEKRMKRGSLEILHDILEVAVDGSRKSHIVYKANLNFNIVKEYLTTLIKNGLLERDGNVYTTTPKGVTYMNNFGDFLKITQ